MPPHPHHPHHHHSHCHSSPPTCCSFSSPSSSPSCCSCCCGCCPTPQSPPPIPDQMVLLQTLLSNQLHPLNPPNSDHHLLQTLANHLLKPHPPPPQPPQRQHKDPDSKTQSLLLSLLRRVSALESQLPNLSPPPPPPPPPVVPASAASRPSLRDVAARTIQARFREFLVRRSRTLRHLKQLAALKSHAAVLRSSLSGKLRVADSERVSQRATDLLLQLDSIQSSDLMIREGKKSITRELTRILEFIDKISSPKELRNPIKEDDAGFNRRRRHSPQSSKAVKRVSFSEFDAYAAPFAEDIIDFSGEIERLSNGLNSSVLAEEHVEDAELEAENEVRYGIGRKFEVQNENLGLYAPIPVHMEPRES